MKNEVIVTVLTEPMPMWLLRTISFAVGVIIFEMVYLFAMWTAAHGADAGDLVGFLGAATGVILAIVGAHAVEALKGQRAIRVARSDLIGLLVDMEQRLASVRNQAETYEGSELLHVAAMALSARDMLAPIQMVIDRLPAGSIKRMKTVQLLAWVRESCQKTATGLEEAAENYLNVTILFEKESTDEALLRVAINSARSTVESLCSSTVVPIIQLRAHLSEPGIL